MSEFGKIGLGIASQISIPKMQTDSVENRQPQYGEVLYDRQNIFHGVGFDFIRLKGILENGILSERAATETGISLDRNYGGYNLKNYVSMAESPSINNSFTFGCFGTFIKDGISFIVKKEDTFKAPVGSSMDSGFADEIFVRNKVKRENITGVMVPSGLLDASIESLPSGIKKMGLGFVDNYCKKTLANLENETGYKTDGVDLEKLMEQKERLEKENIDYLEKSKKRDEILNGMGKTMSNYISEAYSKKLGKQNPTLRDVLALYLPSEMKVYNQDGIEISLSTNPE